MAAAPNMEGNHEPGYVGSLYNCTEKGKRKWILPSDSTENINLQHPSFSQWGPSLGFPATKP